MHDEVQDYVATMLGCSEEDIPQHIIDAHDTAKHCYDRLGGGGKHFAPQITAAIVGMVIWMEKSKDAEPETVSSDEDFDWNDVPEGALVSGFRSGMPFTGEFLGLAKGADSGKLRIQINGDPAKYREVPEDDVYLASDMPTIE